MINFPKIHFGRWFFINKINDVTAVILCGGKSSRMGFDKAFLEYENKYLLLKNINELKKIFDNIILVSNSEDKLNNIKELNSVDNCDIVVDCMQDKGPLGGIYTALINSNTDYVFVTACDMPFINIDLAYNMYKKINKNDIAVCVYENKMEPLFAFYHKNCIQIFEDQLKQNILKIRYNFSKLNVQEINIDQDNEIIFTNINTPEDLKYLK